MYLPSIVTNGTRLHSLKSLCLARGTWSPPYGGPIHMEPWMACCRVWILFYGLGWQVWCPEFPGKRTGVWERRPILWHQTTCFDALWKWNEMKWLRVDESQSIAQNRLTPQVHSFFSLLLFLLFPPYSHFIPPLPPLIFFSWPLFLGTITQPPLSSAVLLPSSPA